MLQVPQHCNGHGRPRDRRQCRILGRKHSSDCSTGAKPLGKAKLQVTCVGDTWRALCKRRLATSVPTTNPRHIPCWATLRSVLDPNRFGLGPNLVNSGPNWSMSVQLSQLRPVSDQAWPRSSKIRPTWHDFGTIRPKLCTQLGLHLLFMQTCYGRRPGSRRWAPNADRAAKRRERVSAAPARERRETNAESKGSCTENQQR